MLETLTTIAPQAAACATVVLSASLCCRWIKRRLPRMSATASVTPVTDDGDDAFFAARERKFIADLKSTSGRALTSWLQALRHPGLEERNAAIDWLRQRGNFTFAEASWIERIRANGGKPIYADPAAASEPALTKDRDAPPPMVAAMAETWTKRKMLHRGVAVLHFLEFMRERGHTGWFASEHIDACWEWFCDCHAIVPIDAALIRAELAAMPACRHGQRRLKSPEFAAVREALGRDRASVYYIPPVTQPMPVPASGVVITRSSPFTTGDDLVLGRETTGKPVAATKNSSRKRVLTPASARPEWREPRAA